MSPEGIKQLRLRHGMARDFAGLLGITPEHLSRLEHGKKRPGPVLRRLLEKIAEVAQEPTP